jgi:hypothetical protein
VAIKSDNLLQGWRVSAFVWIFIDWLKSCYSCHLYAQKLTVISVSFAQTVLAGLKQKSSPNKAQTLFISGKYIGIVVEPLDKTERNHCPKSL